MKNTTSDHKKGHGDHVLQLKINDKKYDWHEQYVTGAQIRKLGDIPESEDVFLSIKDPWKDEFIENHTKVDLARPGLEHFFSQEKCHEVVIIVNGSQKKWEKQRITFQEVVILAFGSFIDKPTMVYTLAYEDGPRQNPDGSMIKGSVVYVKNKMIFHATATDRS